MRSPGGPLYRFSDPPGISYYVQLDRRILAVAVSVVVTVTIAITVAMAVAVTIPLAPMVVDIQRTWNPADVARVKWR